tara:strand:- start:107 stop:292 length:186 start_codon:yes stop_codon:yes gene_type:complete
MTRDEIIQLIKENVEITVAHQPQYHGGEKGPLYLVLTFGGEVISSMDAHHLSRVGEDEVWP